MIDYVKGLVCATYSSNISKRVIKYYCSTTYCITVNKVEILIEHGMNFSATACSDYAAKM